ncbi:cytochrome P450 [Hyaloscypha variabilis]
MLLALCRKLILRFVSFVSPLLVIPGNPCSMTMLMLTPLRLQFPGKVFQVYSRAGPQVFIPPNLMEELKARPDSVLSISEGVREFFQTEHTLFPDPGHQEWTLWIKQSLGKNIAKYATIVLESLPSCWQEIEFHPRMCMLVANLTARVFIGPLFPMEWMFTSIKYTGDLFKAIHYIKNFRIQVRFLFKYVIPSMWTQWKHIKTAARVVEYALSRPAAGDAVHAVNKMLPDDKKKDYIFQGRAQLGLAVASLHTTVRVICQVMFDLAEHPEYVAAIRVEIKGVLKFEDKKTWTVESLALLKKLDSVMKESMRLHGGGVKVDKPASFRRKVLQPITLSDGTSLPPGTFFTTIDNAVTYFGAGRHACPGRYFASMLAKMIVVELVGKYDFGMVEGDTLPRDVPFEDGLVSVNTRKRMMVRKRVD